jgi:DNA invertase Pin-like site-specific DNA recombinase
VSTYDRIVVLADGSYTTETVEVAYTTSHNTHVRQKANEVFVVKREIGYMRVSTDQQDTELQKKALLEAGCTQIYSDSFTGTKQHRPGIDALIADLQPGDRINVWKVDRLGRSTVHGIEFVAMLREKKCAFRSLTQGFDTADAIGDVYFKMLLIFAEFERNTIVERVQAGIDAAKDRGIVGGTRRALDGEKVARARELYANPPISPVTGKRMTTREQAALFGVHYSTYLRWAQPNYFEGNTKDAQRFRQRHADLERWLERSNDPHFADSPRRRTRVG